MRGQSTFYDDQFLRYEGLAKSAIFCKKKPFSVVRFFTSGLIFFLKPWRSCYESFILVSKNADEHPIEALLL